MHNPISTVHTYSLFPRPDLDLGFLFIDLVWREAPLQTHEPLRLHLADAL